MLRFLRRVAQDAYVATLAGPRGQRLNTAVLQMSLRARGYGNFGGIEETGEAAFIARMGGQPVELCIDVGANHGEYSQALLKNTGATVIAFEPHPQTYRALSALQSRYPDRLLAVNEGIADVEGRLELHWGSNSQLASFSSEVLAIGYVGACNVNRCETPVTTLDAFFAGPGRRFGGLDITLLKIDTEGFEYEVLRGARRTLAQRRPKFVQIEFNHHQLFRGHTLYSMSRLLEGYTAHQILPGNRGLRRVAPDDPLGNVFDYANFVFVRPGVQW